MKKRLKLKGKPSDTYRFESPLHMDDAIARLNSELKSEISLLYGPNRYMVSGEKLHDSHYFEVLQRGNKWLPERVVTGTIRQLDAQRSLVECEIKSAERYLPGFEYAAVGILLAAVITTLDGSAIKEMVILLWTLLAIAAVCVVWLRRRLRNRSNPLIGRIQSTLKG
ncbi:MAG: hypothetical protein OXG78_01875 [Chloroflexi bacterium]|nr:hypothetical protein [Chloroflexota bacterium]